MEQSTLWSEFYAAILSRPMEQPHSVTSAAELADLALAEYNKRAKTLDKYERELQELSLDLEARTAQVRAAVNSFLRLQALLGEIERLKKDLPQQITIFAEDVSHDPRIVLVDEKEYILVPNGWPQTDPRLSTRERIRSAPAIPEIDLPDTCKVGDRVRIHWGRGWREDLHAMTNAEGVVKHKVARHGAVMWRVELDFNKQEWAFSPDEIEVIR